MHVKRLWPTRDSAWAGVPARNIENGPSTAIRTRPDGYSLSMANEALFATAGLFGLFVAMLTGALWDTRLAAARMPTFRSQGRHTLPRR
jgi:hypothetical protein